eukprot:3459534-Amphidinium_carterae.2
MCTPHTGFKKQRNYAIMCPQLRIPGVLDTKGDLCCITFCSQRDGQLNCPLRRWWLHEHCADQTAPNSLEQLMLHLGIPQCHDRAWAQPMASSLSR